MVFFFADAYLDVGARQVVRGDAVHRLTPRLFALLRVFLESGGRILSKEELFEAVWGGRIVEEGNLNRAVSTLRRMLRDRPRQATFIETVERVGYRFVPQVEYRPLSKRSVPFGPIVGREGELTTLDLLLSEARGGHESIALVSGEAGMGKTALVTEFLSRLGRTSVPIGHGACPERLAGTDPYASIAEPVRDLFRTSGLESEAIAAFPEYSPSASAWNESVASTEEKSRLLRAMLEWLSGKHPCVLAIDDWHWADASSIDLFTRLAVQLRARPILWVLAFRHTRALMTNGPFGVARQTIKEHATDIDLSGLTPENINTYLRSAFGLHDFPPETGAALFEQTGGNPMFLTGLVEEMRRESVIFKEQEGEPWKLRHIPGRGNLPGSIRTVVRLKMANLSEGDRSLLDAACVQGMEFDAVTVASHCAMELSEALDRLVALQERHGYIQWVGASRKEGVESTRFSFTHILYQNALFEMLDQKRRRDLSLSLASKLSANATTGFRRQSEIAFLSREGEDYSSACRIFRDAAVRAARAGGYREAIALADQALDTAGRVPGHDFEESIRLELVRYHRTMRSQHDLEKAITHCQDILGVNPACTEAEMLLASVYMLSSTYSVAPPTQLIPKARELARSVKVSDPDHPELHTVIGLIQLWYDRNWPAAHESLTRAIETNPEAAMPCQFLSFYWLAMGDLDAVLEAAGRAREKEPYSPMIHSHFAWMLYFARRYEDSLRELRALVDTNPTFWRAYLNQGWTLCQLERYEDAVASLEKAAAMNESPTIRAILAYGYAKAGREDAARRLRARLTSSVQYVTPYWLAWISLALGDIDIMFDQLERAQDDREFCLLFLNKEPALESVRSLPRFQRLVNDIGLPSFLDTDRTSGSEA